MALTTKRIIALPTQTDPQEGDYLAIDNGMNGTHKIPVGRIGVELDDTLTEAGKAADAKATGDAIDALRSQLEVTGTASGAIATFSDGSTMPAKSVIVNIEPQQSGTGTPSPDNVRPISGWDSVDLWSGTANALDLSWWSGRTTNGITFTLQPNGKVRMHGTVTQAGWTFIDHEIDLPYNGIGAGNEILLYSDSQIFVRFYNGNTLVGDAVANNNSTVATIPTSATKMRVFIYAFGVVPTAGTTVDAERSFYLSRNTTFTEWQPYTGTTTTTDLGRTVYGGTLDVVSGALTVDRAIVDLNSLSYERITNGSVYIFQTYIAGKKYPSGTTDFITSCYEVQNSSGFGLANKRCTTGTGSSAFYFRDDDYTDATSFKNSLSGQTLVYYLMTPQTYTLTPTEVSTLLGDNNVWADSGDISVTYVRDLNIAINNLIGE